MSCGTTWGYADMRRKLGNSVSSVKQVAPLSGRSDVGHLVDLTKEAIRAHELRLSAELRVRRRRTIRSDQTKLIALRVRHDDVVGPVVDSDLLEDPCTESSEPLFLLPNGEL